MEKEKLIGVPVTTVGDLKRELAKYPDDKLVIIDDDGNTTGFSVDIWDENSDDSPIALFFPPYNIPD